MSLCLFSRRRQKCRYACKRVKSLVQIGLFPDFSTFTNFMSTHGYVQYIMAPKTLNNFVCIVTCAYSETKKALCCGINCGCTMAIHWTKVCVLLIDLIPSPHTPFERKINRHHFLCKYFQKCELQEYLRCCRKSSWLSNEVINKLIQGKMFLIEVIL